MQPHPDYRQEQFLSVAEGLTDFDFAKLYLYALWLVLTGAVRDTVKRHREFVKTAIIAGLLLLDGGLALALIAAH